MRRWTSNKTKKQPYTLYLWKLQQPQRWCRIRENVGGQKRIISTKSMSDRTALLLLKINERYKMKVIQVFISTARYQDQEVIEVYREIQNLMKEKTSFTIVIGDFDAKLGKEGWKGDSYGELGSGKQKWKKKNANWFRTSKQLKNNKQLLLQKRAIENEPGKDWIAMWKVK